MTNTGLVYREIRWRAWLLEIFCSRRGDFLDFTAEPPVNSASFRQPEKSPTSAGHREINGNPYVATSTGGPNPSTHMQALPREHFADALPVDERDDDRTAAERKDDCGGREVQDAVPGFRRVNLP